MAAGRVLFLGLIQALPLQDSQKWFEERMDIQSQALSKKPRGVTHLFFLTLNVSGPYLTCTSMDAASSNCKHGSKAWVCWGVLYSQENENRAGTRILLDKSSLRPSAELDSTGLFDLQVFSTNFTFPYQQTLSWDQWALIIPLIKGPPKIVNVLWQFDEKEISFNSIPHIFSTHLWHE